MNKTNKIHKLKSKKKQKNKTIEVHKLRSRKSKVAPKGIGGSSRRLLNLKAPNVKL
jgi:hypothetical protein